MSEPCHALVFRDVRERISSRTAVASLADELRGAGDFPNQEKLLTTLLRVGELESALEDQGNGMLEAVIRQLSQAFVQQEVGELAVNHLQRIAIPKSLSISRPEGFAFYGLHPLDYSDAVNRADFGCDETIVVIGIRSIGTTLSAVVAAAVLARFRDARRVQRFTVRPSGHPYDRRCEFSK